ncbi:S8 family serine peptidase [Heyndrickxia coagulans]|uniref:S8 family serine peptidase n=1 Tax=Heyndrickxia coagulans TaxID=1398 RepID=UPI00037FBB64|nr:S8 family serine peptidase [Heyndrickxia coagulans]
MKFKCWVLLIVLITILLCFSIFLYASSLKKIETNIIVKRGHESTKVKKENYQQDDVLNLETVRKMVGVRNKYTGKNVTVAVIDSGIYPHNDLIKPHNRIIAFKDFVNDASLPYDDNGHGTAISGIIAGNGYMSKGLHKGIAPECNLIGIKVTNKNGYAEIDNIIKALKWIYDNQKKYNIKIVNISIGLKNTNGLKNDMLMHSIKKVINSNILVVSSVGNDYSKNKTVYLPAAFKDVLTVGSIGNVHIKKNNKYRVAPFSSYWETKDGVKKPNLLAPGKNIVSIQSNVIYNPVVENEMTMKVSYDEVSGTSESSAVVSGIAALLVEKYPKKSLIFIKKIILNSCVKIQSSTLSQGKGFIYLNN